MALSQLARQAGLSFHELDTATQAFGQWRLPVVAELRDGQLMVIEHFNGEDALDVLSSPKRASVTDSQLQNFCRRS